MEAWFHTEYLTMINYLDFIARILVAAVCGAFIGAEREKRLKNAGLRTHIIVSIAAAIMMIVSKYGFFDVVSVNENLRLQADVSRIAHGVVSAIGFLGAGVIFVRRESIVGLTTAAGLWATVGIGITIGAGMYGVGVITTVLILVIQAILHKYHTKTRNQMAAKVKCNITRHGMSITDFETYMNSLGVKMRDITFTTESGGDVVVSTSVVFPPADTMSVLLEKLSEQKILDTVELSPAM